jgi:DNA-binding transcriptional MerR regulator
LQEVSISAKSPEAFRTISEASDELGVPTHVLRFWEGKFNHLRPLKRAGGRRFYRPQDMAILRGLKALLQDDGYTIRGVQKLIKETGIQAIRNRGQNDRITIFDNCDVSNNIEPIIFDNNEPVDQFKDDSIINDEQNIRLKVEEALKNIVLRLENSEKMLEKLLQD